MPRVRIQEPGHTIRAQVRREQRRGQGVSGARRTLPGSLFPSPAGRPGPPQPRRPGRGTRPELDPGALREEGPSLQPTTRLAAWWRFSNQLAVPRTILSLGAIGLVAPEDFFFFLRQKKGK